MLEFHLSTILRNSCSSISVLAALSAFFAGRNFCTLMHLRDLRYNVVQRKKTWKDGLAAGRIQKSNLYFRYRNGETDGWDKFENSSLTVENYSSDQNSDRGRRVAREYRNIQNFLCRICLVTVKCEYKMVIVQIRRHSIFMIKTL